MPGHFGLSDKPAFVGQADNGGVLLKAGDELRTPGGSTGTVRVFVDDQEVSQEPPPSGFRNRALLRMLSEMRFDDALMLGGKLDDILQDMGGGGVDCARALIRAAVELLADQP